VKIEIKISSKAYQINIEDPIDISIPLIFNGDQPNAFGVEKATSKACEVGNFIGDTRRGGSCNFEEYKFITHCNGTHTECIGHISHKRISVNNILKNCFIPSTLITVKPEKASETNDTYIPDKNNEDLMITKKIISDALKNNSTDFLDGLIIRTLPNSETKKYRKYEGNSSPFFSLEAIKYIVSLNVKHILIDTPSVDRPFDEGNLSIHRIFWDVSLGSYDIDEKKHSFKTITELIYVPNDIGDGNYFLNLQIPNFVADAAPSRPIIYNVYI
jgi:kynurenine formamidase